MKDGDRLLAALARRREREAKVLALKICLTYWPKYEGNILPWMGEVQANRN